MQALLIQVLEKVPFFAPFATNTLSCLRELDLDTNVFSEVPKVIFSFVNLEKLIISNNFLTSLPDGFTQLKNLKVLDARGNKLKELPLHISKLFQYSLKSLYLDNHLCGWESNFNPTGCISSLHQFEQFRQMGYEYEYEQKRVKLELQEEEIDSLYS